MADGSKLFAMLSKAYDPKAVEDAIYARWEESGAFRPEACDPKGEPFTISMPPPNATGQLHLGHAVMLALEDIFIRFARMQGKRALWVPGTDHAAIATENVVIKQLKDAGMKDPRKELGREKLVAKIAEFVEKSKATIRSQVRKMGSSCDWSRERYTFEPTLNRCVNEVFRSMYEDGLIYRGHRIVNWDPKLQTTVSDDEVEYKEETTPFFTFQYGPFQIATSRPETKFGDKYVVMHPDDRRYTAYKHGDTFEAEWINGKVRATVIKDDSIDPEFGTGVMTITPWHDHADFAIAEKHGLEKEQVIGFDGKLLSIAGEFAGMKIEDARPLIVEKLKSKGLLVKTDEHYVHNKAVSQRGGGSIEPQIKLQWFIDINKEAVDWNGQNMSLKQIMHAVIHHGDITIIPEQFQKTYYHWIDHLRDWCISRQIWWGHRVPVFYCRACEEKGATGGRMQNVEYRMQNGLFVSVQPMTVCPSCGGVLEQDPDTLDTWFSSALWTWSTLVDPKHAANYALSLKDILEKSPDYQKFHPTSVMETGYDILFFWVARMILMTTYATGQIPFRTVYLHGLIRTRDGSKMSKSHPETMIDPLDMIAKYGADALRLSMIVGQSPGADSRLYEEKIAGYRNFINKLWNASRFVLMECEKAGVDPRTVSSSGFRVPGLSLADRAILHAADVLTEDVTRALASYKLSEVGERLYGFVWDTFCDWYLELSKGNANHIVLIHVLRRILLLLHPYCPFVTEELWESLKSENAGMLIAERWPVSENQFRDHEASQALQILIDVISAIRKIRAEQGITPGKQIAVVIETKEWGELLESQQEHIRRLGKIESLTFISHDTPQQRTLSAREVASAFLPGIAVHVSLAGLIDRDAERTKLQKEKESLERFIATLQMKLDNADFVARAPEKVIAQERMKLTDNREKLVKIEERLRSL